MPESPTGPGPGSSRGRCALAVLGASVLVGLLACGKGAAPSGFDQPVDERVLAAYQCMPPAVQRTYVDFERRRVDLTRELVRRHASVESEELEAAARDDARLRTLSRAQGSMLQEYAPATPHGSCDTPP